MITVLIEVKLINGGIDYLGGTLETYGNVNSGDSLYAIKKLVFDDKEIRYKDMVDAIRNNFIGYEEIREKCLNVIKYGNDNPEVDEMINELNQYVAVTTKSKSEKYGLSSYLIVIIIKYPFTRGCFTNGFNIRIIRVVLTK